MPITTTRDRGQNLTEHVVTGPALEAEMYRTLEDFYAQEPTDLLLWDMSNAEVSHVTPDILRKFVQRAAKLGVSREGGRTAILAPEDLQFGLGRMTETFADIESTPYKVQVFRSRQDALKWLMPATDS